MDDITHDILRSLGRVEAKQESMQDDLRTIMTRLNEVDRRSTKTSLIVSAVMAGGWAVVQQLIPGFLSGGP
ncbi:MAG: hypothetical protein HQL56_18430, partial [Magnetococcales bacterium]|nr:hypothetical protein [Magnetococcales bacterium]